MAPRCRPAPCSGASTSFPDSLASGAIGSTRRRGAMHLAVLHFAVPHWHRPCSGHHATAAAALGQTTATSRRRLAERQFRQTFRMGGWNAQPLFHLLASAGGAAWCFRSADQQFEFVAAAAAGVFIDGHHIILWESGVPGAGHYRPLNVSRQDGGLRDRQSGANLAAATSCKV